MMVSFRSGQSRRQVVTNGLETPDDSADLYLARDQNEILMLVNRPHFTGDILKLTTGEVVALVQHPCAMRKGTKLAAKLLVCSVKTTNQIPADWSGSHYKQMFLPALPGGSSAIHFDDLDVVARDDIEKSERLAILSELGVNLLVQRWLHHNSRVVVPTITIHLQTSGPYEEADLVGEAVDDLRAAGIEEETAVIDVDAWLGQATAPDGPSRRELLANPQTRGSVRSSLRRHVRDQLG